MRPIAIARLEEISDREPFGCFVEGIDLVVVRDGETCSVLYGRCHHRGARLTDGFVRGGDLICGLHGWDYRIVSGISSYDNDERLHRFDSWTEGGTLWVDGDELGSWLEVHPQRWDRDAYQGAYQDSHPIPEEPHVGAIRMLAAQGLASMHGPTEAMGVARDRLPSWDDIQFLTAQLARLPQLDEIAVGTDVTIGPRAKRPLHLSLPLFVSDMSFGALSREAKIALARGAELSGTGIASGEGGMLGDEQEANSRYFHELASGRFGFSMEKVTRTQALHFKGGQGAKSGTGGHLPGAKVMGEIALVRGLPPGQPAISPAHSPSGSSSRHSTSRTTSMPRSRPMSTTSSSMDVAARRVRRRRSCATTSRCRRGRRLQRRDAGDRLHRHARLPHQQLPGRDRHSEATSARPPAR